SPTALRWKHVAAVSLATFCVFIAGLWLLRNHLLEPDVAPYWFWVAVGVLVLLGLLRNGPRAALSASGVIHASHWPPYWLGLSAGCGLAMLCVGTTSLITSRVALDETSLAWLSFGGAGLLTLPFAVALPSYAARRIRERRSGRTNSKEPSTSAKR